MMKSPLFIAFEGIDGSGKSTQIERLSKSLESEGHKVFCTAEPSKGPIGKMIRDIFNHRMSADHKTIAALFLADRLEHLLDAQEGMIKKLNEGFTVITDRYYFSSYAYHGAHIPLEWVIELNLVCADLLKPDVHIYLDIDPEMGMKRISDSRGNLELFENLENQKLVKAKYLEAISLLWEEENVLLINGSQSVDKISEEIWNYVQKMS